MNDCKLSVDDIKTIQMYASCNMNGSEAARKLYVNKHTVDYQFERIRERTGLNPKNFYDLVRLLQMILDQKHRELSLPTPVNCLCQPSEQG